MNAGGLCFMEEQSKSPVQFWSCVENLSGEGGEADLRQWKSPNRERVGLLGGVED